MIPLKTNHVSPVTILQMLPNDFNIAFDHKWSLAFYKESVCQHCHRVAKCASPLQNEVSEWLYLQKLSELPTL